MAVLYTKEGAVKLSEMLMKSTHHSHTCVELAPSLQHQITTNMRSTSITGEGLDRLPVFFHQCTQYTTHKRASNQPGTISAPRDLHCQCQGQSLKFRHFSTNHRAELPSNIRISGTNFYFLFTGVHYTKVSSTPRKKDNGGA